MEKLDILEELADMIDDRPAEEIKGFVKGMIFTMYLKESFVQGIRDGIEEAVEEFKEESKEESKVMSGKTDNKFYERKGDICNEKYNDKIADIAFDTYEKVFNVMSDIDDILKHSGEVTVKDFFNICDLDYYSTVKPLSCRFYGWKDISSFSITRDDDGYFHINMPPVVRLV